MTNRIYIVILMLMMALTASAQEFTVKPLQATNEITASQYPRLDANNQPCALLKVEVVDAITKVEGGVVGEVVDNGNEKWVYFESGQKMFKIHFANHLPVTINYNEGLQANNTYVLTLVDNSRFYTPTSSSTPQETVSTDKSILTFTVKDVSFNMIKVDGGTFMMGAYDSDSEAEKNEKPRHEVTLSDYYIGETEVTQTLWKAVMGSNPSYNKGDNLPVENFSWNDCQEFISKLNAMTGATFCLTTEAEWEFAARGGNKSQGYKYSGSDDVDAVAWYQINSKMKTHDVKTKQANELGIYDMSGNVEEWCSDWYNKKYYGSSAKVNPTGPSKGSTHVSRGGGCRVNFAKTCTVTARGPAGFGSLFKGMRLALHK